MTHSNLERRHRRGSGGKPSTSHTGNMILMGIAEIGPMRESEIESAQSLNITP